MSGTIAEHLPDIDSVDLLRNISTQETAQRIASAIEDKFWKRGLDGKEKALTWPKAVTLYLAAGKSSRFLPKLVKYWGR